MEGLIKVAGWDNPGRKIDVVFVHGLDGDPVKTWQYNGEAGMFWPEWLGSDEPSAGIWSLGYAVKSSAWRGNTMPLSDRATNALDQLTIEGIGLRPLIFICHSLGGLLVKQMLRHAYDLGNEEFKKLAEQTRGVVFLSTPHSGSDFAGWIKHLGGILRTTVSVDELQAHHDRLRELNIWYRNHPATALMRILVYCEKKPVAGVLVVNESSADPGIRGVNPVPMDEDHVSICKPKDRNSQIYRRVLRLIEDTIANP